MTLAPRSGGRQLRALLGAWLLMAPTGCGVRKPPPGSSDGPPPPPSSAPLEAPASPDPYASPRADLVKLLAGKGIRDEAVLAAMNTVPRHLFVPEAIRDAAYFDRPLPIGSGQTISQPFVVATMTEGARVGRTARVLEIGTGSGYQAAILGELCKEVYTIEIVAELGERAKELLTRLGYDNVHVRVGDGYAGWPERAPFDAILITAAPEKIPDALRDQLAVGGRLIMPIGPESGPQWLMRYTKRADGGLDEEKLYEVMFVPMTGKIRGE